MKKHLDKYTLQRWKTTIQNIESEAEVFYGSDYLNDILDALLNIIQDLTKTERYVDRDIKPKDKGK